MATQPKHTAAAMASESPRIASRLIKFLISLAFYAFAEGWRALLELTRMSPPASAVVIYYHHVSKEQRESFARQLDQLARWTTPLRGDFCQPLTPNARYSIVTVDDGWKSFADYAVPELQNRNIPVAMFAISARLGSSVDGIGFDRLVTPDELRALDPRIVTIGSHTATHAIMTALSPSDAARELRESRAQLAAILGHDVTMFCFPYGAYSDDLLPLCREAGYQRVFTCMPALANPAQFVLGRVRVDPTDWPLEFHLKLMGAYRWLPMAIALKRRLLAAIRGGSRPTGQPASRTA
jgi:peptidoglycan/xylan/chitin deacetylase (PgdA/CDA1 family)